MPRSNFKSDRGSAPLEVMGFGVVLMIPVMWFGINLLSIQNDQFAAAAIAEHGLRAWVQSDAADSPRFEGAVAQIAADFHEPRNKVTWIATCRDQKLRAAVPCAATGQLMRLEVKVGSAEAVAVMRWGQ